MLDDAFSRSNLLVATDLQALCAELSDTLTARVRAARNVHMELEWIVADLRALGHDVRRWDEVIANWETKDDPYLWIWIEGLDLDAPSTPDVAAIRVAFRPRLPDRIELACPFCGSVTQDAEIHLAIRGHGSVTAPSIHVDFTCPGLPEVHAPVGIASLERRRRARVCTKCGAGLLPPPRT